MVTCMKKSQPTLVIKHCYQFPMRNSNEAVWKAYNDAKVILMGKGKVEQGFWLEKAWPVKRITQNGRIMREYGNQTSGALSGSSLSYRTKIEFLPFKSLVISLLLGSWAFYSSLISYYSRRVCPRLQHSRLPDFATTTSGIFRPPSISFRQHYALSRHI